MAGISGSSDGDRRRFSEQQDLQHDQDVREMNRERFHEAQWWEFSDNVNAFGRHLAKEEGFTSEELLGYFAAPYDWDDEYNKWKESQC